MMAKLNQKEVTVHGKPVDSINEYYVSLALDALNLDYNFQYFVGAINIRGSQSIDFLVKTAPKPTPLFIHGEYWHAAWNSEEESFKMAEINRISRGTWADVIIIWEHECETEEDARKIVNEYFK